MHRTTALPVSDLEFSTWLADGPTEDELREAYLALESRRTDLWTPGHIDSFRRDRFELDSTYVDRLVQIKWALAQIWTTTGQFDRLGTPRREAHLV